MKLCLNKIINNKAMIISKDVAPKNSAKIVKEKVVISQQMLQSRNDLINSKRKRKRNITNVNKVFVVMLLKMMNQ